MKHMRIICALALGITTHAHAAPAYNITDLGSLLGVDTVVEAMNDHGEMTGYLKSPNYWVGEGGVIVPIDNPGPHQPFIYRNGTLMRIAMSGEGGTAVAINNAGTIVGHHTSQRGWSSAYKYQNGQTTYLGSLKGGSGAHAINDQGDAVGSSGSLTQSSHAVLFKNGQIQVLTEDNSSASGINNAGQIVGQKTFTGVSGSQAFLYDQGNFHNIGALLGATSSSAASLNDAGDVVGSYTFTPWWLPAAGSAFLYRNGQAVDLGSLQVGGSTLASSINNLGAIVGTSGQNPDGSGGLAFIHEDGSMVNLNSLIDPASGWLLNSALQINNVGQILGEGYLNGSRRQFLLNPVPVPEADALWMLAFAAPLAWRLAKSKAKAALKTPSHA